MARLYRAWEDGATMFVAASAHEPSVLREKDGILQEITRYKACPLLMMFTASVVSDGRA